MNAPVDEAALFDRQGWWDPDCREFASLRRISAFRLELLDEWLDDEPRQRRVVDLGCGGGLLALPLAERGAKVIGVDLAEQALREAGARARTGDRSFRGVRGSIDAAPIADGSADVVLLADVVEHVDDPGAVVAEAARILRPGGHLFVNTIDRSLRSRVFAIWLGEGLGLIPRGTHQWARFVRPEELDTMAARAGLKRMRRVGEAPRLWATARRWSIELRRTRSTAVGYAALYRKNDPQC